MSGNIAQGDRLTDLEYLYTLTPQHRLEKIRVCTDSVGLLKGLQATAVIPTLNPTDRVNLHAMGSLTPPDCRTDLFEAGESITEMTLYFSQDRIEGIKYTTQIGST